MPRPDTLIRTKIRQPFTRPGLVPRPQLQEQITLGLCGPLTLITAPAGFGKTTLAASAASDSGMPTAWLSLDRDDNQTGRFLTYLIAAVQEADPAVGADAAQLASGLQPAAPEAVLTSLINDLDRRGGDLLLVLDDYHFISSQAVHGMTTFLLEHCPSNFHLLIATRSDPPLPLARLRARGQTLELRAADLRFSIPEAAQFLNDVMGLHLDTAQVSILEERTEGWVAGLQMAALSMRDRKDAAGFVAGFSGTNRYILDYLLEEVLASQPPEIQRFLLRTSILERLTVPLCDALLADGEQEGSQTPSSSDILNRLERDNIFLIALDEERAWFRYHHLFADLLRIRLKQDQPGLVPALHTRAAAWLESNGFISEAIHHLLAAHEYEQAADLIERYASERRPANDLSIVQMAEKLPHNLLLSRPKLGLYQAWLLINQGNIEKAYPLLMDLAREFAVTEAKPGQDWIEMIVNLALAFLTPPGYTGNIPGLDASALDKIPSGEWALRDTADLLYAMTLTRRDDNDRAVQFSEERLEKLKPQPGMRLDSVPSLVPFLAVMYLFQGRLHKTADLCRQYILLIRDSGLRSSASGNLEITLGNVMYQWNYLDEAETQIRAGLHDNEPWPNIMTDSFGVLALAELLLAKGEYPEAFQNVDKLEAKIQTPSRPVEFAETFRTQRIQASLASGDLQAVEQWANEVLQSEDYHLYPGYYQYTLASIRLAQGRYAEAESFLIDYSLKVRSGNELARVIAYKLLYAGVHAGLGRSAQAFQLLDEALALGEAEEYVRVFLNAGKPTRELLAAYLRQPEPGHQAFARKILEAFPRTGETRSAEPLPAGMVEALSERELEVLGLLALGQTNQEIARRLFISPGTVKAHTASIYRKLDAANRTEAVARARSLNLLS